MKISAEPIERIRADRQEIAIGRVDVVDGIGACGPVLEFRTLGEVASINDRPHGSHRLNNPSSRKL